MYRMYDQNGGFERIMMASESECCRGTAYRVVVDCV